MGTTVRPEFIEGQLPGKQLMSFWVYILRCADGSYYTGHTDNLDTRIQEHHMGAIRRCYTFRRRPLQLVFFAGFPNPRRSISI